MYIKIHTIERIIPKSTTQSPNHSTTQKCFNTAYIIYLTCLYKKKHSQPCDKNTKGHVAFQEPCIGYNEEYLKQYLSSENN